MEHRTTILSTLVALGFFLLAACQAPQKSAPFERRTHIAQGGFETVEPTAHVQPAIAAAAPQDGAAPNRDLHGPTDTARYVEMLQSEQRIRELKPDLVAENIMRHAKLGPDAVIADVGCGPGIFLWPLVPLLPDGYIFAADVEPAQLDAVRVGLLAKSIDNVVPVLASYTTPHLPAASCDAIFIADTYHHFDDRIAYMELLRTRLSPGGYLVLLEYKDGDLPVGPPAKHKVLKIDRHAELRSAGYELERELSTHIFHDFEFWRVRRAER
jgi:SAM-dependent methyltransferase